MWDWVGGRFSLWVVGLTIEAVGMIILRNEEANEMDTHFKTADFDKICSYIGIIECLVIISLVPKVKP
jgi:glucose-6-phosphate isomerase